MLDKDNQQAINELISSLEAVPTKNGHHARVVGQSILTDQNVLGILFNEVDKGRQWEDVYNGNFEPYYPSPSEAVGALLWKFAFYTGKDPVQMERLIRGSALPAEKFDDRRKGTTWLALEITRAIEKTDETYTLASFNTPKAGENGAGVYSHHTHGGFGENKKPLPIKTVEELIEEAGEGVDWVVENLLARGSLTEFSGKAKKSGKTTFWCHAIIACAKGVEHAGFSTEKAKYLYLTEQGNNFVAALRDSGLTEHPDHIRVIQFKDVSARGWETLIRQAGAEAHKQGMAVLVVDTFAVFAGLKGSEENDSGPVADRMRTLRLVAQKYNLAVLLIRHAGKDGTPRGSSAFEAEADICVTLARPEGRHAPNVRRLEGIGRYGEWERNVQLRDGGFVSLGDDNKVEFNKAVRFIKAALPEGGPETGIKKQALLDMREGEDKEISASTIDRALSWLVKQEAVGEKQLVNERGKPKVYWRVDEPTFYSHQTPSAYGENKTEDPLRNGEQERTPLSFDARPGEMTSLEELRRRRTTPTLTTDDVLAEFQLGPDTGASKALAHYQEKPEDPKRLEYLVRAVLYARREDPEYWSEHREAVQQAAQQFEWID